MKIRIAKSWYAIATLLLIWVLATSALHLVEPLFLPGPGDLWLAFWGLGTPCPMLSA
jgi:ABC-type nitrate/sulfonate/bicarbonate transport system permease component